MVDKHNVYMAQVNYQYGDNVFVPYSVGSIQAYCQTLPHLEESFQFQEPLFRREDPEDVVRRLERPAVVGFSSYLWNWEHNKRLAEGIKDKYPEALIVFGGTQVPHAPPEDFFAHHPYVDVLVHHEGENAFAEILSAYLSGRPEYTAIGGLSVRVEGQRLFRTTPRGRVEDLAKLPSPYLTGVFDFLVTRGYVLNASQETNRGCPYSCTFCDWGSLVYTKVRSFGEDRLLEEFDWFGRHRVEYIFNCDANYGILPRDHDLTVKMTDVRAKHGGYPRKFRMCTAKNSNDKIFNITKLLNDAGMNKGATLSFQSMDEQTLAIAKRKNIKIQNFSALMRKYRDAGISTYTELIVGLPGESYESFTAGFDTLIDAENDAINIYVYLCAMLPNSELSDPAYVEKHGIKAARQPILLAHSTPEPASIPEFHNVVIETATMPHADWERAFVFAWAIQCFHCLGLLRHIAILLRRQHDVRFADFYERFLQYFAARPQSLVGRQLAMTADAIAESVRGGRLDRLVPGGGEICWPLEEAAFLEFITHKISFYAEVRTFLGQLARDKRIGIADELLDELVRYEAAIIIDPSTTETVVPLAYNLHEYFSNLETPVPLTKGLPSTLTIRAATDYGGNLEEYAKYVVWYGRKGGRFHHSNVVTAR